jgi:hypothetical protein
MSICRPFTNLAKHESDTIPGTFDFYLVIHCFHRNQTMPNIDVKVFTIDQSSASLH